MRQAVDLVGGALALGNVLLELHKVAHTAIGLADGRHHHGLDQRLPVLAVVDLLTRPAVTARQRGAQALALRGRQAVAGVVGRGLAHHLVARVAGAAHKGLVHVLDVLAQIGDDDGLGALLHGPQQLAQRRLAGCQIGCGLLGLAHPAHVVAARQQRGGGGQHQNARKVHRTRHAVGHLHRLEQALHVRPDEAQEQQGREYHQRQRGTHAQQPSGQHNDHGVVQQIGAIDAAIARRHQRHRHPHAPHQQVGGQRPPPPARQQQRGAANAARNKVERHAHRLHGLVPEQQQADDKTQQHHGPARHPHQVARCGVFVVWQRNSGSFGHGDGKCGEETIVTAGIENAYEQNAAGEAAAPARRHPVGPPSASVRCAPGTVASAGTGWPTAPAGPQAQAGSLSPRRCPARAHARQSLCPWPWRARPSWPGAWRPRPGRQHARPRTRPGSPA